MKYIILNKWKLQGAKPQYYLKEVVEGLDVANKKLNAYQTIETDKNDNFLRFLSGLRKNNQKKTKIL